MTKNGNEGNRRSRNHGTPRGRNRGRGGRFPGSREQHHLSMLEAVVKYREGGNQQGRTAGGTVS